MGTMHEEPQGLVDEGEQKRRRSIMGGLTHSILGGLYGTTNHFVPTQHHSNPRRIHTPLGSMDSTVGGGNAGIDVMEEAKEERDDSIPWLPGDAINELREVGCCNDTAALVLAGSLRCSPPYHAIRISNYQIILPRPTPH